MGVIFLSAFRVRGCIEYFVKEDYSIIKDRKGELYMKQEMIKLISENQVIMLDTSVAMDDQFKIFVDAIEMPLMENRKKIIVKSAVWSELLRHIGSSDPVKQRRATTAVDIIGLHHNIFEIGDSEVNAEKILRAFADAEFLADLMIHKSCYTQALLTNDKKLCRDANKLNEQESCLGKQISVYNLNAYGNIEYCPYESEVDNEENKNPESIVYKGVPKESCNLIPIVSSSAAALTVGVIIGKYGKQILKLIKDVA